MYLARPLRCQVAGGASGTFRWRCSLNVLSSQGRGQEKIKARVLYLEIKSKVLKIYIADMLKRQKNSTGGKGNKKPGIDRAYSQHQALCQAVQTAHHQLVPPGPIELLFPFTRKGTVSTQKLWSKLMANKKLGEDEAVYQPGIPCLGVSLHTLEASPHFWAQIYLKGKYSIVSPWPLQKSRQRLKDLVRGDGD